MDSTNKTSEREDNKSDDLSHEKLRQEFNEILNNNLQFLKTEIQDTYQDIKLILRGIQAEIEEIKSLASSNRTIINQLTEKLVIQKKTQPKVKEITTGLDLLTEIPQHLRRTFETVMQFDERGATASQVSARTGKSRPLESDYLNQLSDRGLIYRQRDGKKVRFFSKFEDIETNLNHHDENESLEYIIRKKDQVGEVSNSTRKS